jgi:hypothetical protein
MAWDVGAAAQRGVSSLASGGRSAANAVGNVMAWDVGAAAQRGVNSVANGGRSVANAVTSAPGAIADGAVALGSGAKSLAGKGLGLTKVGMKKAGKVAAIAAAVVGSVYLVSRLVNSMRSNREYHPEPQAPDMAMMPDAYAMDMQQQGAMMGQPTLMGMAPVEGAHAQRVLAGRGQGMTAGVDASSPAMEQDGRSTVDGRPIQDLGSMGRV